MTELAASFAYIETTLAPGVTVAAYRRSRTSSVPGRRRVVVFMASVVAGFGVPKPV
jgi:hypothetical protein